jgi:hypothetical protein
MSEQVLLGPFTPKERGEEYLSHMNQGNTLLFENSGHLVDKAMKWLDEVGMQDRYAVGAGNDMDVKGFLILRPKSTGRQNREFSKNVGESKLAKMRSKLAPK